MSRVKGNHKGQCHTVALADMGTVSRRAGVGSMWDMVRGPDLTCYLFMKIKFYLTKIESICFGLPWWLSSKRIRLQCRRHKRREFDPWVGKIPWRRKWQPTPVFLPEKFHGQRSLVGHSPWGLKESGMAEHTHRSPFVYCCLWLSHFKGRVQ